MKPPSHNALHQGRCGYRSSTRNMFSSQGVLPAWPCSSLYYIHVQLPRWSAQEPGWASLFPLRVIPLFSLELTVYLQEECWHLHDPQIVEHTILFLKFFWTYLNLFQSTIPSQFAWVNLVAKKKYLQLSQYGANVVLCMQKAVLWLWSPALPNSCLNLSKSLKFVEVHCPHLCMRITRPTSQDCFENCLDRACHSATL